MNNNTKILGGILGGGLLLGLAYKFRTKKKTSNNVQNLVNERSLKNINTLHPLLKKKALNFIVEAAKQGFNLIVVSGLRTYAEQQKLYEQGRTTKGAIVTNSKAGYSNHNFGLAFDVAPIVNNKINYNIDWSKLSKIAANNGLDWGGNWKSFKDKPHFELKTNLSLAQMRALKDSGNTNNGFINLTA